MLNLSFWALLTYSRHAGEGGRLGNWVLRWRYLRQGLRHRSTVERLLRMPAAAAFRAQVNHRPELMGFFLMPFLNATWGVGRRFDGVIRHHDVMVRRLPWLCLGYMQALQVLDLGHVYPGLEFVLEDAPWFLREGCINFSMKCAGERLMSLSFTLDERDGQVEALVGSIQGSARESVGETYRSISEATHDLRPRDLHFKVFRLLLESLGVTRLRCVADDHRVHHHPFFGGAKAEQIKLRYDELWEDQGGTLGPDGFYVMPAAMEERPLSEVPPKKRGRYKRRLEMFDQFRQRLQPWRASHGRDRSQTTVLAGVGQGPDR